MKNEIDIIAVLVGFLSALIKAIKKGLSWRSIVVASISGAIFSWGIIGVLTLFFAHLTQSTSVVIAISYIVGRLTDSIIEKLDLSIDELYIIFIEWLKNKLKIKK